MIDVTAQQQRFTLINIYGPNFDSPSFLKKNNSASRKDRK